MINMRSERIPSLGKNDDRVTYRNESGDRDPLISFGNFAGTSSANNDQENGELSSSGNVDFIIGEISDNETDTLVKYDDFDTIDWTRDRQQDRIRLRRMKKMTRGTFLEKILEDHDAWSGWLVVLLVGLSSGLFAGIVDIGADWMSNLQEGICTDQFWFDKESCCWADNTSFTEDGCQQWKTWAEVFGRSSGAGAYVSNYFMYTLFAMLFAGICVTLVHTFAPYACGSGIPEVRWFSIPSAHKLPGNSNQKSELN